MVKEACVYIVNGIKHPSHVLQKCSAFHVQPMFSHHFIPGSQRPPLVCVCCGDWLRSATCGLDSNCSCCICGLLRKRVGYGLWEIGEKCLQPQRILRMAWKSIHAWWTCLSGSSKGQRRRSVWNQIFWVDRVSTWSWMILFDAAMTFFSLWSSWNCSYAQARTSFTLEHTVLYGSDHFSAYFSLVFSHSQGNHPRSITIFNLEILQHRS